MKNNKAFTLIELITVIVVLGIVSMISIPVVTSIIESSKMNNYRNSIYGLLRAVEEDHTASATKHREYTITNGVVEPNIEFGGDLTGSNGSIRYDDNEKTTIEINNGKYCASKAPEKKQITVVKCP